MPRIPGFKSDTQRERFLGAASLHVRGGPLARLCGAKLRRGGTCTQLALADEARCLRHAGPDAARRFRVRQEAGLETGSVSPDVWARAEAKRARNALQHGWRKNPSLPGRTIDLGPDEATFVASAVALGVDVDRLYPAVADWLRWRWRRHQKDRPNDRLWLRAVREDLPRQIAAADEAMGWIRLGVMDRRTKAARAAKAAMRVGGVDLARAAVAALDGASGTAVGVDRAPAGADGPTGPMTRLPVRAWTARPAADGWKRRQPDRPKAAPQPPRTPRPIGRPRKLPDSPDEFAALGEVLRAAGPKVRAMYGAIAGQADQFRFLRDLAEYANAPDNAGARAKWLRWVKASDRMG